MLLHRNYVFCVYIILYQITSTQTTEFCQLGMLLDLEVETINAKMANHSDVVECSFEILVSWRHGSGKPDSMTTFKNSYHQTLTDLERIDLVEFVGSGERPTDPH